MRRRVMAHDAFGLCALRYYADNTRMLYGDGAEMANQLVSELKALDGGH